RRVVQSGQANLEAVSEPGAMFGELGFHPTLDLSPLLRCALDNISSRLGNPSSSASLRFACVGFPTGDVERVASELGMSVVVVDGTLLFRDCRDYGAPA